MMIFTLVLRKNAPRLSRSIFTRVLTLIFFLTLLSAPNIDIVRLVRTMLVMMMMFQEVIVRIRATAQIHRGMKKKKSSSAKVKRRKTSSTRTIWSFVGARPLTALG